ncbi:NAD(P)-dependent alcohol dehydrogenase [Rhodoplanes sp. TEM]|uniref:NAD(P)-dependent alcohol dehydrogenase n=1 Tax=Rhodoplanes tepidamans TaxID=200616 RepID=A0ABT5JEH9_RHOTP|nr:MULTISPECIES: NAD(P)-dependent alcohol dehydrogenase [Rhodoplanes]MDC7787475.1 NAD(P)-dependent alcohol dehydrogenase [Rhodoplanes tepidamans]MDC7983934.1 NAD(P)-dependent alcohol dehydrogenase [Rhodoplanes sp. TEM]MDQ0354373.1 putative zinc-type alcohol dehydrogenase-like protein [Rhodoplanes tepidamans]
MFTCTGYAAGAADQPLAPFTFQRRDPGPTDVAIEIVYCGVCHSDLHTVRGEWGNTLYPCVPGHEIVGRVTAVGGAVTRFSVGDTVGVGCMVDSCRTCASCREGLEQYCDNGFVGTYNGPDRKSGGHTFGGYASAIVVEQDFVLKIPKSLDLAAAAPLLCAGITLWSPLRHWKAGPGKKVGIVGLGGLGHMGVKLAHALGAHLVLFTTSKSKVADGERLGADEVVLSTDPEAMKAHTESFDLIVDAVAADHDINAYLGLVKRDGTLVQVGAPEKPLAVAAFSVIWKRRSFAGSLIGGIAETQEMLDFCGAHGITSDIEMIPMQKIEEAYARMLKSDVKYRFVIDMASLKAA